MKGRLALAAGVAVGYVLGARAGRERYEQLRTQARTMWRDPRVQQKVSEVEHAVQEKAPDIRDVRDSVTHAARKAVDTASARVSRHDPEEQRDGMGI
jgi:hypothetical protein